MLLLEWRKPKQVSVQYKKRSPGMWERLAIEEYLQWHITDAFKLNPRLSAVKKNGQWFIVEPDSKGENV